MGRPKGYRGYKYTSHGKIITWMQRRCTKCQRFLSDIQRKYCLKCSKKVHLIYVNKHRREKYNTDINWKNSILLKAKKLYKNNLVFREKCLNNSKKQYLKKKSMI